MRHRKKTTAIHQRRMTTTQRYVLLCNILSTSLGVLLFLWLIHILLFAILNNRADDFLQSLQQEGSEIPARIKKKETRKSESLVTKYLLGDCQYYIGFNLEESDELVWEMVSAYDFNQLQLNQMIQVYYNYSEHYIKGRQFPYPVQLPNYNKLVIIVLVFLWTGIRFIRYRL